MSWCVVELTSSALSYTPQTAELEHSLKPFIPDFIPAVGDIDAFLKVRAVGPRSVSPVEKVSV